MSRIKRFKVRGIFYFIHQVCIEGNQCYFKKEMNNIIQEKESSLRVMQNEFSVIKDFRVSYQTMSSQT